MEIKKSFVWLSAKKYAEVTGMGYHTVLKLCRKNKLPCVETEGGEISKQFQIKYYLNENNSESEKLYDENTKLKTQIEFLKNEVNGLLKLLG